MREILFRGKSGVDNKWYYGYLEKVYNDWRIFYESGGVYYVIKVDPETVGQFTGLLDKNGTKIFEGDILEIYENAHWYVAYCLGENGGFGMAAGWYLQRDDFESWVELRHEPYYEVLGNIHDNPRK